MASLGSLYVLMKRARRRGLTSEFLSDALSDLISRSLEFIRAECEVEPLRSLVEDKRYVALRRARARQLSRPVNSALFAPDVAERHFRRVASGDLSDLDRQQRAQALYTTAIAYCCAVDLSKGEDAGSPGTFFEVLVGHQVARLLGIEPKRKVSVEGMGTKFSLETDYVFHSEGDRHPLHLPVKLSTRERGIQVWAYQRIIDGVFGTDRVRGVLVCLTETNKLERRVAVAETCIPEKWAVYQKYIARMHRVYYLDPPAKYLALGTRPPHVHVKHFTEFFDEAGALAAPSP